MRRPINFIVVVWGAEFCGYFLRFCLSSLLAPNNIPKLCSHRDRFLIATTADDRRMLEDRPEMQSLKQFLTVEYVEIDRPQPGVPSVTHSNKHLIGLLQRTWERREYGV